MDEKFDRVKNIYTLNSDYLACIEELASAESFQDARAIIKRCNVGAELGCYEYYSHSTMRMFMDDTEDEIEKTIKILDKVSILERDSQHEQKHTFHLINMIARKDRLEIAMQVWESNDREKYDAAVKTALESTKRVKEVARSKMEEVVVECLDFSMRNFGIKMDFMDDETLYTESACPNICI